ncbi:MAG: large subunit ribosomal protein [Acidobacteriaceae bacterium]|nr:large subunit ribosomal protein [Acidobacteriaceae bacterium]
MALTKQKKAEQVAKLAGELQSSSSAIIGTFAKLTVAQDFALRKTVRDAGGKYKVLKNKLAERASKGTQLEQALRGLKGVSSVAYTSGDPVALTKAISGWVSENAEFTFKLGIVDGRVINVEEIRQLATMPGKDELFAKLLFLINSPAQRLATVINATGRDLAVVINQAVEQSKFGGPSVAESPVTESPVTESPVAESAAPASPVTAGAEAEAAPANAEQVPAQPEAEAPSQVEAAASEAPVEG